MTVVCSLLSCEASSVLPGGTIPGLVSIVIPCFNAARFLEEAVRSALAQSYGLVEIIIVDDGSTDGTAGIIHSFGSAIRAEFGPNRGASAARNLGTQRARGEFIQYLDADDVLPPEAVEQRVRVLEESGGDVAYSDWQHLVEVHPGSFEHGAIVTQDLEAIHADPEIAMFVNFWAPPVALTYRASIVRAIGGWKEWLAVIQDARFLQDAALQGARFVRVRQLGGLYRVQSSGSLSNRNSSGVPMDSLRNAIDLEGVWREQGRLGPDQKHALAKVYAYTASSLFAHDVAAFRLSVSKLYAVEPEFRFTRPKLIALAASILGYQASLRLLSLYRALKASFRRVTARSGCASVRTNR